MTAPSFQHPSPTKPNAGDTVPAVRTKSRGALDPIVIALVPVIIIAGIIGSLVNPAFLTTTNIVDNIITTSAVLGVVVIAESVILIGG